MYVGSFNIYVSTSTGSKGFIGTFVQSYAFLSAI
nr:MAG TPA: hypothetical protein [Caudoviricetes sp.]